MKILIFEVQKKNTLWNKKCGDRLVSDKKMGNCYKNSKHEQQVYLKNY